MAAHRYWRLNCAATSGGGTNYVAIDKIEMRTNQDGSGSNLSYTGNGTATASSVYSGSYPASDAFDSNTATRWASQNATAMPQWIKWDFGGGNEQDINHLTVKNHIGEPSVNALLSGGLEYSDDDSTWYGWIAVIAHPNTAGTSATYVPITYEFALTAPMPTSVVTGGNSLQAVMPIPTVTFREALDINVALPMPSISITMGESIQVTMPSPTVVFEGGPGLATEFEFAMPMATVQIDGGEIVSARMPMPTAVLTGTTTILIDIAAVMPMPTVSARITSVGLMSIEASMAMATVLSRGGGKVSASMPMPAASMSGTTGSIIRITAIMPMAEVESAISSGGVISIAATMPMLVPGPWGHIVSVMPMADVLIIGRSVVAVTYEAYAINLKPGNKIYEVTHYTNYPFNQIVRHGNDWYGVADDGLYLITGTTDYDPVTPTGIPWDWQTCITDFGSSEKKSVTQMSIGGRVGPTATATVSVGEKADVSYSYSTPRGQLAQNYRVKFGRGLQDRYYSFGLSGTGMVDVDSIDFDVEPHSRKI